MHDVVIRPVTQRQRRRRERCFQKHSHVFLFPRRNLSHFLLLICSFQVPLIIPTAWQRWVFNLFHRENETAFKSQNLDLTWWLISRSRWFLLHMHDCMHYINICIRILIKTPEMFLFLMLHETHLLFCEFILCVHVILHLMSRLQDNIFNSLM